MKKLSILIMAFLPACAYGAMLDDAVNEVEGAIDNLNASQCIEECGSGMSVCLDQCDVAGDQCEAEVDACMAKAETECSFLPEYQVSDCLNAEYDLCDNGCDDLEEMCEETCGDVGVQCISDCVEEMEAELKNIDLDGSD
jgi:hypothetical protein